MDPYALGLAGGALKAETTLLRRWNDDSQDPDQPVQAAAFSPDGKRFLLGLASGAIQVNALTRTFQNHVRGGEMRIAQGTVFSPDSRILLTGSFIVYDVAKGKRIWNPLLHPLIGADPALMCAFSPDGKTLLISDVRGRYPDERRRLSLYERAQGQLLWTADLPHGAAYGPVAFTSDGKGILRLDKDKVFVHDARNGDLIGVSVEQENLSVEVLDYRRIAESGQRPFDLRQRLRDLGFKAVETLLSSNPHLHVTAISPDHKTVVIAEVDGPTRLWDVDSGRFRSELLAPGSWAECVAYSPDGKAVLVGGGSGAILADAASGDPLCAPLTHENYIECLAYSPDGKTVATGSLDRTARIWDAATGHPIGPPLLHQRPVVAIAYSPDGKTVLTGSEDGTARLWDAATAEPTGPRLLHQGAVRSVAFGPDGQTVLTGGEDGTARLWELTRGIPTGIPLVHRDRIGGVAYSPDGKTVITASLDKTAQLWDAATGEPRCPAFVHQSGPVPTAVTRGPFGAVFPSGFAAVAFSPDGKTILLGNMDKTARLWDVATGRPIGGTPMLHEGAVVGVAFNPNGRTLFAFRTFWQG
jgi:WD40 repeat protein